MSGVLIAVPALPLLAAAMILVRSLRPREVARFAIAGSAAAFAAALVALFAVAVDGPLGAVITGDDGRALVGVTADRVGAVLIVLTTAVGMVVQSFAARSLLGDPRGPRFHLVALLLTSATSLVAVAATSSGVVVAWIATSIGLVALLGHKAPWRPAVESQRLTARSFAIGDLALVLAVGVAIVTVGDIDMRRVGLDAAALDGERIGSVDALTIVAILLVVAGAARSALIPMHRWLPSTLAAPTPVSALLHAGVVNGAGVLLIRFAPVYASSVPAMTMAFVLGIVTALVATAVMLVRTDVKGSLVWSTSGQMGFMVLQLGVGAFAAALFHIVGHALYKAAMFLGAGGAISAHRRQTLRPHLGRADRTALTSTGARVAMGLVLPLGAFALALRVIEPHLTAAATILITVFGTLAVGRAANGWMSAAPFTAPRTIALSASGVVVMAFGYIGGIALFEGFVADVVPYEVPAAVGPVWVSVVLAAIGAAAALIAFTPGDRGDRLRRRVYAWLVSTGAPAGRRAARPAISARRNERTAAHATPVPELVTVGDPS